MGINEAWAEECTVGIQRLFGIYGRKVANGGNPAFFNGYITSTDGFAGSVGNPRMTDNPVKHFLLPLLAFAQGDCSVEDRTIGCRVLLVNAEIGQTLELETLARLGFAQGGFHIAPGHFERIRIETI